MGIKRHKPEEIVTKLRQVEVLCGQGMPRLPTTGTRNHRSDGTQADHALTFKLDQSGGADQGNR